MNVYHVLLISLLSLVCQAVPPGYVLKVTHDCGSKAANGTLTDASVTLFSDLRAFGKLTCSDGTGLPVTVKMPPITDGTGQVTTPLYYPGDSSAVSGVDCFFFHPNSESNFYVAKIEVFWGYENATLMEDYETFTLSCTIDGNSVQHMAAKSIDDNRIAITSGFVNNLGNQYVGTSELKIFDVMDHEIDETRMAMGKKIYLDLSVDGGTVCPDGWTRVNRSCYLLRPTAADYTTAQNDCQQNGGFLAEPTDVAALTFIIDTAIAEQNITEIYIGATYSQEARDFVWGSGGNISDFFWQSGQPDNSSGAESCVLVKTGQTPVESWNDVECTENKRYICQKDSHVFGLTPYDCEALNSDGSKTYRLLIAGCGDGIIFRKSAGFITRGKTSRSPYFRAFKLIEGRGRKSAVKYRCSFTVCNNTCDGTSCALPSRRKRSTDQKGVPHPIAGTATTGEVHIESVQYPENEPTPESLTTSDRSHFIYIKKLKALEFYLSLNLIVTGLVILALLAIVYLYFYRTYKREYRLRDNHVKNLSFKVAMEPQSNKQPVENPVSPEMLRGSCRCGPSCTCPASMLGGGPCNCKQAMCKCGPGCNCPASKDCRKPCNCTSVSEALVLNGTLGYDQQAVLKSSPGCNCCAPEDKREPVFSTSVPETTKLDISTNNRGQSGCKCGPSCTCPASKDSSKPCECVRFPSCSSQENQPCRCPPGCFFPASQDQDQQRGCTGNEEGHSEECSGGSDCYCLNKTEGVQFYL